MSLPLPNHSTMTNQLNGQATRVKFFPGLGFAPVIDQPATTKPVATPAKK